MVLKKIAFKLFSLLNYYYWPDNLNRHAKIGYQEPEVILFSEPEAAFLKLSAQSFHFNPDYARGYRPKPMYLAQLSNVTFLGNSGAVVRQNKIISESVYDHLRLSISPAYRSPAWMWSRSKKGVYTSIIHLPWAQSSNFHWFFDCLPRLYLLAKMVTQNIQVIVNVDLPDFQRQTLQFILKDLPHFKLVYISKNEKWHVEQFILPSFITNHNSGYLPEPVINFMRNKIWQGYNVLNVTQSATRLYISRGKASKRKLQNERELLPILAQNNFKIVYAEDLSYQEQVQLFYGATHVIAPHGAGLTNILFAKNCAVLELQAADVVKPHYFLAAKSLGHFYHYLLGSASDNKLNFTIDPAAFSEKLQEFLKA